jgi:phage tail-like protein
MTANKQKLYDLLSQAFKDDFDKNEVFKTIVEGLDGSSGLQISYDYLFDKMIGLYELYDPDHTPAMFLDSLLTMVGWNKATRAIKEQLTENEKRRLIDIGAKFWLLKGIKEGLIDIFRIFTGKSILIRDYFDFRVILGEDYFEGYDWSLVDVWGENALDVEIMDDGTLNRPLTVTLMELLRGMGEQFNIIYMDFLETWDLAFGSWHVLTGVNPTIIPYQICKMLTGQAIVADTLRSSAWKNYWWQSHVNVKTGSSRFLFYYNETPETYYYVELSAGLVKLGYYDGSDYTIQTTPYDIFIDCWYYLIVSIYGLDVKTIRVMVDDNRVIDTTTMLGIDVPCGTVGFQANGELQLGPVELYERYYENQTSLGYDGLVETGTIDSTVAIGYPVYYDGVTNTWLLANKYTPEAEGIKITYNTILLIGYIRCSGLPVAVEKDYFLKDTGGLTI